MRLVMRLLPILLVCAVTCGCTIIENATRNLIVEPWEYWNYGSRHFEIHRNRKLAKAAWTEYQASPAGCSCSSDYGCGFQEGYTDFLTYGGTGCPPYVPPRRYWRLNYQTPQGYAAAQDWFAGFRAGSVAAQSSGYRNFLTVPSAGSPYRFVPTAPSPTVTDGPMMAPPPATAPDVPAGSEPVPTPPAAAEPVLAPSKFFSKILPSRPSQAAAATGPELVKLPPVDTR